MSFKEINALRQAGKLKEALLLSQEALNADPENIWNKRAAAWAYYEALRKFAQPHTYDRFRDYLNYIRQLELPQGETMLFDNCAFQIGKLVFALQRLPQPPHQKLNELFNIIQAFHFTRPSEAYSFIFKAFHKNHADWPNYLAFADWWGFEHFMPGDYQKEEYEGRKIMSIVEQAYIAYSRKLLEGESTGRFPGQAAINKEKVQAFMPLLDEIVEQHPEYQYPAYYKAKLMMALGDEEDLLTTFLPFARKMKQHFWVWQLLAEMFPDDEAIQLACYCKALSLNAGEEYIIKLRQEFANMLVKRQMYDAAKTEISRIVATRQAHDWRLPNIITQWTQAGWYKSAKAAADGNKSLYAAHTSKAEALLLGDVPEEVVAVNHVNPQKKVLAFVKDKKRSGLFYYGASLKEPQVGDVLRVRLQDQGNGSFFKLLTAEKADADTPTRAIRAFEGTLKIITPKEFGFADQVLLLAPIIKKHGLKNGQQLSGKAVLSYNKKKETWGWLAFSISS